MVIESTDSNEFTHKAADASLRAGGLDDLDTPDWLQEEQRQRAPRSNGSQEQDEQVEDNRSRIARAIDYARNHKVEVTISSVAGAVALTAAGILFFGGGSGYGGRSADAGDTYGVNDAEVDGTISSVTLVEGANLRFDPYVSDENDPPNLVESLDAPITVDSEHDFKIINGTDDGQWIGIPVADIKKVDPQFDDHGDNDGFVWVNEKGYTSVERVDLGVK